MASLIWWQFKYSWRKWLGTLFVFVTGGVIAGFTLIGISSTISAHLDTGEFNPIPFFAIPTVFGAITLVLIVNGVTRLLVHSFSQEYALWAMLGANINQLSALISGQMTLISLIGASLGYFLSYPIVISIYGWIRTTPGMTQLPQVPLTLSVVSFIGTLIAIGCISALMTFVDARRIFSNKQKKIRRFRGIRKYGTKLLIILICVGGFLGLAYLYSFFFKRPAEVLALFSSKNTSLPNAYTNIYLGIVFITMILFSLMAPLLLPLMVKALAGILPHRRLKTFETAYWSVLDKRNFLKSVVVPLFIFTVLSSYFTYMALDLVNVATRHNLAEVVGTISIFLGAPFLIIFANMISITITSSTQRNASIRQLQLLGFTWLDFVSEKVIEAFLYAGVVFLAGLVNNIFLYGAVLRAAKQTHVVVRDSWLSIAYWPFASCLLAFFFVLVIDLSYTYRISIVGDQQKQ